MEDPGRRHRRWLICFFMLRSAGHGSGDTSALLSMTTTQTTLVLQGIPAAPSNSCCVSGEPNLPLDSYTCMLISVPSCSASRVLLPEISVAYFGSPPELRWPLGSRPERCDISWQVCYASMSVKNMDHRRILLLLWPLCIACHGLVDK